jgi:hypothetical protein
MHFYTFIYKHVSFILQDDVDSESEDEDDENHSYTLHTSHPDTPGYPGVQEESDHPTSDHVNSPITPPHISPNLDIQISEYTVIPISEYPDTRISSLGKIGGSTLGNIILINDICIDEVESMESGIENPDIHTPGYPGVVDGVGSMATIDNGNHQPVNPDDLISEFESMESDVGINTSDSDSNPTASTNTSSDISHDLSASSSTSTSIDISASSDPYLSPLLSPEENEGV